MTWLVEIAVCSRRCRHCRSRLGKFAYCDTFTSTAFRSSFAGVGRHCLISFSSSNVVLVTLLMSGDSMKHKGSYTYSLFTDHTSNAPSAYMLRGPHIRSQGYDN